MTLPATKRARAQPPRSHPPASRQHFWILAAGVAVLAILVHANALGNGFVFDDLPIIRDNPRIRDLAQVPALYGEDYWGMWGEQGLYRPFVLTTYALNYAVGKLEPRGYIAVNLVLHALASVLVLGLARSLGAPLLVAGAAGLL